MPAPPSLTTISSILVLAVGASAFGLQGSMPDAGQRGANPFVLEVRFGLAGHRKTDHQWNVRNVSDSSIWCPWRIGTGQVTWSFSHYAYRVRSGRKWTTMGPDGEMQSIPTTTWPSIRPNPRRYPIQWAEIKPGSIFSLWREQHDDNTVPWDEVVVRLWCRRAGREGEVTISWKKATVDPTNAGEASVESSTTTRTDTRVVQRLIDKFAVLDAGNSTCNTAAYNVVEMKDAAVPALRAALSNGNERVRYYAVNCLRDIDSPKARAALIEACSTSSSDVRAHAAYGLAWRPFADAEDVYLDYLKSPPPNAATEAHQYVFIQ